MIFTRCDRCYKEMPSGVELQKIDFYIKEPAKKGRRKPHTIEVCAKCFKAIRDFSERTA